MNQLLNAARLLNFAKPGCKIVRVKSGVANLTDGESIIIRMPTMAPDGFYNVGRDSSLIPVRSVGYVTYPDIEVMMPPVNKLLLLCKLDKPMMEAIVSLANAPFVQDPSKRNETYGQPRVQFGPTYFGLLTYGGDPTQQMIGHPFNVNPAISLEANRFSIAMSAMLEYNLLGVYQESDAVADASPLIIGDSLTACILLYPNKDTRQWR